MVAATTFSPRRTNKVVSARTRLPLSTLVVALWLGLLLVPLPEAAKVLSSVPLRVVPQARVRRCLPVAKRLTFPPKPSLHSKRLRTLTCARFLQALDVSPWEIDKARGVSSGLFYLLNCGALECGNHNAMARFSITACLLRRVLCELF